MSYIEKPRISYGGQQKNQLGLTVRDYEGGMSTLCAGCGHDSISAALVQAFFELNIPPHRAVKMSGIGCSSKTPAYFLGAAHGINGTHGRMAALATGANAANRELYYVGVSGDGDSLSIGLGQFAHAMRRNLNMLYIIENNGVYGLTKGQFSASADIGTRAKHGEVNVQPPIDPVSLALCLGGSFVARSFSGDKRQLVPLIKAGLLHDGFALIDVISPCVTFADHAGSTKSYAYSREHMREAVHADFVPREKNIEIEYPEGAAISVQLHDGSLITLRKVAPDFQATDRGATISYLDRHQRQGEIVTGLLHVRGDAGDLHHVANTVQQPLNEVPYEQLCPGAAALDELHEAYR
ncbi:MAG: 2-oxoacid:ferredoxin oxidoreductase subunit beta [Gammaproteobacteria bacterium]|nr:2-oxoacid:ferredoxin oxidoreductase subunit beta [Gammaproteobacteria bacterium]